MKQEKIHDALDLLDDGLVEAVDALRRGKKAKKRWLRLGALAACLCAAVLGVLLPALTGSAIAADDLMKGIAPNPVPAHADLAADSAAVADFGVRLFQNSLKEGENTLISPLSVLCALAMTANGAEGETLEQMEDTLGLDRDTLNAWVHTYLARLPQGDKYKLSLANSIWFTEDESFTVNRDFLQTNADYYGADIYQAPFDSSTVRDINNWVDEHTDGMIPHILDQIQGNEIMYLVNALAFDAQWREIYNEHQVRDGLFTTQEGEQREAELMYSTEDWYLEDDMATGFMKHYEGGKYAFVGLLPREGVRVEEYAAALTGERLQALLAHPEEAMVRAAIPKFESETTVEMSDILAEMGMADAFDAAVSDFSGLGVWSDWVEGPIYISRVLHKTFIQVDERGTKAGAATVVAAAGGSAQEPEYKTVYLDRPFVYLLVDCETNVPFFMGTMMDVAG